MVAVSVINTLLTNIKDRLEDQLVDAISDETKAGIVKIGLLRTHPSETVINVTVKPGDDKWRHTLNMSAENVGMKAPLGEIGGGIFWRRRFIAKYDLYFSAAFTQEEAQVAANVVVSRAEHALQNKLDNGDWWFDTLPDDFEEIPSRIQVYDTYAVESGDVGKWIWRGETRLEFLTEKVGCI